MKTECDSFRSILVLASWTKSRKWRKILNHDAKFFTVYLLHLHNLPQSGIEWRKRNFPCILCTVLYGNCNLLKLSGIFSLQFLKLVHVFKVKLYYMVLYVWNYPEIISQNKIPCVIPALKNLMYIFRIKRSDFAFQKLCLKVWLIS